MCVGWASGIGAGSARQGRRPADFATSPDRRTLTIHWIRNTKRNLRRRRRLLLSQCLDRVKQGRLARRVIAKEQAGPDRERRRQHHHLCIQFDRQVA